MVYSPVVGNCYSMIKSVTVKGDSAQLTFASPKAVYNLSIPGPRPGSRRKPVTPLSFLPMPFNSSMNPVSGTWMWKNNSIVYWPRNNENLQTAQVVAPYLQTIARMEGTIDAPVSHIYFKGLDFKHATWLRPSQAGHVPLQAGHVFAGCL